MIHLDYHNIKIEKAIDSNKILIKGEVTNRSEYSFSAVAVRVILFEQNIPIVNVVFTIPNVLVGTTKTFEKKVDDTDFNQIVKVFTRYEIYTESYY